MSNQWPRVQLEVDFDTVFSISVSSNLKSAGYDTTPIQFFYQIKRGVWGRVLDSLSNLIEKLN
jgi:hypothetical protein